MNQYNQAPPVDPETIIAALAGVYPKTMALSAMQPIVHANRHRIGNVMLTLVAQGRVKPCAVNCVSTVYRLSEDEARNQGFKTENPVRNTYELLTARPLYTPPRMAPARQDAEQAMQVMSRDGDRFRPHARPISLVSTVRGGA